MHSCRLNLPLLLPCELLVSMQSCFLHTTRIVLARLLMLCKMMPASSSCLISWSVNLWHFSSTVYSLNVIGGPSMGMSSLIKLVLPISIALCKIICKYLLFRSFWSLVLASLGMSASGMEVAKLLVSGSSCKLVCCSIWGSSLEVSHGSLLQLSSWASLHLHTGCIDAIGMFLPILHRTLLPFRMGMFRYCGVLWSTLCKICSRMMPSESWKVSALTSYRLVVLGIWGL